MNFKNTTILVMFFCMCIPFVLLNNFYPFWRFGMFAEPVKTQIQTEQFKIYRKDKDGKVHYFSPQLIGFDENQFLYIARNYYYKSQAIFLLRKTSDIFYKKRAVRPTEEWQLYRLVATKNIHNHPSVRKDSSLIQTLKLNVQQ